MHFISKKPLTTTIIRCIYYLFALNISISSALQKTRRKWYLK